MNHKEYHELLDTAELLGTPITETLGLHPNKKFRFTLQGHKYFQAHLEYIRPHEIRPDYHWFYLSKLKCPIVINIRDVIPI